MAIVAKWLASISAVLIFLLALFPCIALHINVEAFLLLVGQNPAVARLAGQYMLLFIPGAVVSELHLQMYSACTVALMKLSTSNYSKQGCDFVCTSMFQSFFMYIILSKYMQNQNIVLPNVFIGLFANGVNALLHYVFVYVLDYGTKYVITFVLIRA